MPYVIHSQLSLGYSSQIIPAIVNWNSPAEVDKASMQFTLCSGIDLLYCLINPSECVMAICNGAVRCDWNAHDPGKLMATVLCGL